MRSSLKHRQILYSCSRSLSLSLFRSRSDFHQISQSPPVQTKRYRLFFENFLNALIGLRFSQWELFLPLYNLVRFYFFFILTISHEEYQMKSIGKNLLLYALFKFSTTKRLYSFLKVKRKDDCWKLRRVGNSSHSFHCQTPWGCRQCNDDKADVSSHSWITKSCNILQRYWQELVLRAKPWQHHQFVFI